MFTKTIKTLLGFAIFVFFFCTACNAPQSKIETASGPQFSSPKIKTAFKEVMAIHDEVMPFISDMKRSKRQLESTIAEQPAAEQQQIQEAISLLVKGDSLMFDWMGNFKTPEPETPEAEALPYLASEKEKVSLLSSTMKEAMQKANALLNQQ